MPQTQTSEMNYILNSPMTIEEKLAIGVKSAELWNAGDREESTRVLRTIPLPPYLAKVMKETMGLDFLINGGWNLTEVEEEFGSSWLSK